MKALLLAGGFAKRLWPLTKDKPKPLLEVGGKLIIDYSIERLEGIKEVDEIIISTNAKFEDVFEKYIKKCKSSKKVSLVIEETHSEGEKLGSIGGLAFVLKHKRIDDDLLIIGADNIFEFDLKKFIEFYKKKKKKISIALHDLKDKEKVKGRYGVCVLDNEKIAEFQEKPEEPKSALASTACYIFSRNHLKLVFKYLEEGNNPDAIGFLITWLVKETDIYGFVFREEWFDIGSFEALEEADKYFKN